MQNLSHWTTREVPNFHLISWSNILLFWNQGTKELQQSLAILVAAKSLQLCPTLCDPIGGSPPDSPVPGILQARTLEWVAISFSNAWKWKVKVKSLSHVWLFSTPWTAAHQAPPSMGFSRQEHWSRLPFPSPVHESEKWKWSRPVVSDSQPLHGPQPTRLLRPWDFPGKSTGVGCHSWMSTNLNENNAQEIYLKVDEASEKRMMASDLKVCKDFREAVFVLDSEDGQERWRARMWPELYLMNCAGPGGYGCKEQTTDEVEKGELGQAV